LWVKYYYNLSGHVFRLRRRGLAGVCRGQLHVLGRTSQEEEEGEETTREGQIPQFQHFNGDLLAKS